MSITLDSQSKKVLIEIDNINQSTNRAVRQGLFHSGKLLRASASKAILKKKFGKLVKHKGRPHRQSVRGEAWANKSGRARRGLGFSVRGARQLNFTNVVSYSKELEGGLDRPAMRISIEKNTRNITATIIHNLKKELL